jgi:hypothetical protein
VQHRERAAKLRQRATVRDERCGNGEDVPLPAPDGGEVALLKQPPHLAHVEPEPLGDVRDGQPLADERIEVVHGTRVPSLRGTAATSPHAESLWFTFSSVVTQTPSVTEEMS